MKLKRDPKNAYWPLPADYETLDLDAQKQARLSVLMDQSTPEKLVTAWHLFRNLYLKPAGELFYKGGFVPSPAFHYNAVRDLGEYARNALGAPRGSAKSTIIAKEVPLLLLLTRPYYPISLCLSTDSLVEARFDEIMIQLTENPFILEDFGNQRPKRGTAIWNHHHLHLINGATLQGFSVMGRKRGARPRLFLLDDPENDPDSDSLQSQQILLEKFERILFRQIIPMLEHGSAIFWIGTLINRRSFLYRACCDDDPRFAFWNRRILSAIDYDSANPSHVSILWEEKWPKEVLEARRAEIGATAFAAEYENNPTSAAERTFTIQERPNEYTIDSQTDVPINPFELSAEAKWYEREPDGTFVECVKPFNELVKGMFRISAFDYASGLGQYNDYSCVAILGFDTNNCLWVLDMWMGRARERTLLRRIYEMSQKWLVRAIGVESASIQISFVDSVTEFVRERAEASPAWTPRVVPVKYPSNTSKADRIQGLDWRFGAGRIKYPAYLKSKWPINMLYAQTADFTPDLALLRFDDAIDTLAMSQFIVHTRGVRTADRKSTNKTLLDQIKEGRSTVPGMPVLSGVNSQDLSAEELHALIEKSYLKRYNEHGNRFSTRRRPNAIDLTPITT